MFGLGKEKLELVANETALVLIDLEHGIVARGPKPHDADEILANANKLAAATRAAGGTVVYVHVLLHDFMQLPADKPMMPKGTPTPPAAMSELVDNSGYQAGTDVLVAKNQWDAFYGTSLKSTLDAKGIKTIVLGGIATNFGVESTARSAIAQGIAVVFAEDAMGSMSKDLHEFAVENVFPVIGKVRSTEEVLAALYTA